MSLLRTYLRKIPMETGIELYFAERIDFLDTRRVMYRRYDLFTFVLTLDHLKWFLFTFLCQLTGHTKVRNAREVGDVYNRGKSRVYTSGIFFHQAGCKHETLERAQQRKIDTRLDSIHLQKGESHLNIARGWGTLVIEAAKRGAKSTGCTLTKEQVTFAKAAAKTQGVEGRTRWIVDDYCNIHKHNGHTKFDNITCVEMAEYVAIKTFQPFLLHVYSLLKDDAVFYTHMCGVRRATSAWSVEDVVWILFRGAYVFPGADASTAINQEARAVVLRSGARRLCGVRARARSS